MSDDLVGFIRARLDEDEAVARRACQYAVPNWRLDEEYGETVLWWEPEPRVAEEERRHGLRVISDQWRGQTIESHGPDIAPHIARHDPARVLAEVAAKRRVLRDLEQAEFTLSTVEAATPLHDLMTGAVNTLRRIVHLLAAPYADHPDYREEWRP